MTTFSGTNFAEIQSGLVSWIQSVLPINNTPSGAIMYVPVVEYYDVVSVRPTTSYISYQIRSITQKGFDYVPAPGSTLGSIDNFGVYEMVVTLVAHSSSISICMQLLQAIRQSLQNANYDNLTSVGVSFMRFMGDFIDASGLVGANDTFFERRMQMDIVLCASNIYGNSIGQINIVNATGNIENQDGAVLFQENISVNSQEDP